MAASLVRVRLHHTTSSRAVSCHQAEGPDLFSSFVTCDSRAEQYY